MDNDAIELLKTLRGEIERELAEFRVNLADAYARRDAYAEEVGICAKTHDSHRRLKLLSDTSGVLDEKLRNVLHSSRRALQESQGKLVRTQSEIAIILRQISEHVTALDQLDGFGIGATDTGTDDVFLQMVGPET